MDNIEYTEHYKDCIIEILQDELCGSPDSWGDNGVFLVYSHRYFTVTRKGFIPEEINNNPSLYNNQYWIFPVEAYIHSGVSLSLFNGEKRCNFDSSVSGFILVSKKEFKNEDDAENAAECLILDWNDYLCGDVYRYIVSKSKIIYSITKEKFDRLLFENDLVGIENNFDIEKKYESIDSCGGFYGNYTKSGILDEARAIVDNFKL